MTKTPVSPQLSPGPGFSLRKALKSVGFFFIVKDIGLISNPRCDSVVESGET